MERPSAGKEDPSLTTRSRGPALRACVAAAPGLLACAPTVDVLGVYFPGWLVSTVVGLVVAYATVRWLSGRPATRDLGRSGVLFCTLTVSVSLLLWWILFSGY